ncbi:MAG: ubiquinone biosynthesis regulatory protein kinase UbiB [Acidiferrobacterales bacterium]|nr:ubiquinone biosynthesis regulatory protein kinase UbiB [Acidiferrobacterales bacterium]
MFKNLSHLYRIARVLISHNLDEFVVAMNLGKPWTTCLRLIPRRWRSHHDKPRGERLRMALEELGPVFVKFGQVLSTRPDLIPADIHQELTKLQDSVPPFPGDEAKTVIETAYGDTLDQHFSHFETQPVASASVAQVHYANLLDGSEVVVKVLRPGIKAVIDRDLALLHTIAMLVEKYWQDAPRFKPREIVSDYDKTIHDELNLMREAANASQLKVNFEGSDLIHVPAVYWDHCRRNVMVMERIYGISIRDIEAIKAAGIDMRKLAHDGVEIFFTQAFRDGFFHADMHPGNIFVAEDGQYRAVDFGIMGTLSDVDKRYLAENLLGFFHRNYRAVAEAHIRAGWVPPDTVTEDFEAAVRTVCEPIFAKPISEISFGVVIIDLLSVARRFQMPVQPQLVLLQKTLLNIEGLGRQLYAELDLWETAKPFLERWMSEQIGPRAAVRALRKELPNLATIAPEVPALAHQLLYRVKNDEMIFRTQDEEIKQLRRQIEVSAQQTRLLVSGIGLVVLSFVFNASSDPGTTSLLSWVCGFGGVVLIAGSWLKKS